MNKRTLQNHGQTGQLWRSIVLPPNSLEYIHFFECCWRSEIVDTGHNKCRACTKKISYMGWTTFVWMVAKSSKIKNTLNKISTKIRLDFSLPIRRADPAPTPAPTALWLRSQVLTRSEPAPRRKIYIMNHYTCLATQNNYLTIPIKYLTSQKIIWLFKMIIWLLQIIERLRAPAPDPEQKPIFGPRRTLLPIDSFFHIIVD